MKHVTRKNTYLLLSMMDDQLLDPIQVIQALAQWMPDEDVLACMEANEFILPDEDEEELVKDHYVGGLCPDCDLPVPDTATEGEECENCGHVFWTAHQAD